MRAVLAKSDSIFKERRRASPKISYIGRVGFRWTFAAARATAERAFEALNKDQRRAGDMELGERVESIGNGGLI